MLKADRERSIGTPFTQRNLNKIRKATLEA
jgi:hypothetical protein